MIDHKICLHILNIYFLLLILVMHVYACVSFHYRFWDGSQVIRLKHPASSLLDHLSLTRSLRFDNKVTNNLF